MRGAENHCFLPSWEEISSRRKGFGPSLLLPLQLLLLLLSHSNLNVRRCALLAAKECSQSCRMRVQERQYSFWRFAFSTAVSTSPSWPYSSSSSSPSHQPRSLTSNSVKLCHTSAPVQPLSLNEVKAPQRRARRPGNERLAMVRCVRSGRVADWSARRKARREWNGS